MPLSGEIIEFNEELETQPELVNSDPYEAGWIIKIQMNNNDEVEKLLNADAYNDLIN